MARFGTHLALAGAGMSPLAASSPETTAAVKF
jgi:hypothetical protein